MIQPSNDQRIVLFWPLQNSWLRYAIGCETIEYNINTKV